MSARRGAWWFRRFAVVWCAVAVLLASTSAPAGSEEPGDADAASQPRSSSSADEKYSDEWLPEHESEKISQLRGLGIFEGTDCGDNKFCLFDQVDRKTFAVWMVRVLDGKNAPDFVEAGQTNPSSTEIFEDIPKTHRESAFIERLAGLGITTGCSLEPARYCPDETISRGQLATFVSRALDLPKGEPVGFWDVDKNNRHFDSVNSLVAADIDYGCGEVRFMPFEFCVDQPVTKKDLAIILSELVDYMEAAEIIKIHEHSRSDNSINLRVGYDKSSEVTTVYWGNPTGNHGVISHYIVQPRPQWANFSHRIYEVVDFDSNGSYRLEYSIDFPLMGNDDLYEVRVITAYKDGSQSLAGPILVPNDDHRTRDFIKTHTIDKYSKDQPWLKDVWRHISGPMVTTKAGSSNQVNRSGRGGYPPLEGVRPPGQLDQTFAGDLEIHHRHIGRTDIAKNTIIAHELGHVYTLTNGITKNEASIAAGHIYLYRLVSNHDYNASRCIPWELYADMSMLAFDGTYNQFDPQSPLLGGHYWQQCRFEFDNQEDRNRVTKDVRDMIKKIFLNQEIPQWFYDRYQQTDNSIDLDKLWSDISAIGKGTRAIIIYGLRNEFGGYCSREDVRQFAAEEIDSLETPWVDSGNCEPPKIKNPPEEPELRAGSESDSGDCTGDVPIVVASDAAAQSDRYSAATLAGVLGTDCIIVAGPRDAPFPADQLARLHTASTGGFIVGGTAAVPDAKTAGHDLKRLAGDDRWHTARLVGAEAVMVAGGTDTGSIDASAGAQDPTTDCSGDIPIVVASDQAAQSDRYSAATLAGVLGTDCIILAGPRDAPFPTDQLTRLSSAATPGFIVGGTAAIPDTKTSGYDLTRIAGDDRWGTARLVGDQARRIAASQPTTPK